jgi:hypothetical protein
VIAHVPIVRAFAVGTREAPVPVREGRDGLPRGLDLADRVPERPAVRLALGGEAVHLDVCEGAFGARLAEGGDEALWHTVREIEATREAVARTGDVRAVPQNGDACTRYGSPCPYLPVCEGTASITDDTRYRRLPVVHAELSADIQTNTLNTRKAA